MDTSLHRTPRFIVNISPHSNTLCECLSHSSTLFSVVLFYTVSVILSGQNFTMAIYAYVGLIVTYYLRFYGTFVYEVYRTCVIWQYFVVAMKFYKMFGKICVIFKKPNITKRMVFLVCLKDGTAF